MIKILMYNQYFLLGISGVDHLSLSALHKPKEDYEKQQRCLQLSHSLVNQIVQNDIYVDDCLSGEENEQKALERADQVELVLNCASVSL